MDRDQGQSGPMGRDDADGSQGAGTGAQNDDGGTRHTDTGQSAAEGTEPAGGFAAPGGYGSATSGAPQAANIPPAPQHSPYPQVPGAPAGYTGYTGYLGQPGQPVQPGQQGYQSPAGPQWYQGQPGDQGNPGYPAQPGYAGYPGQPGYPSYGPPPSTPGKGLAIAALVLAVLALLICWIVVVNFLAFPLALVALGLGIPALVKGLKARNAAKTLSIVALSLAGVSIVTAVVINILLLDSLRDAGVWEAEPGTGTEIGGESFEEFGEFSEELSEAENNDYSYQYSEEFIAEIVAAPANSAGEEAAVGEYTVTLSELDRDGTAEVLDRAPSAGDPDHNYVIARFEAVYNGDGEGRPWLDLAPELVGSDNRVYTVLGCTVELGMRGADQELLSKGDTVTHEVCFDVPDSALGEDSRLGLRMILAEENSEDVYWRLP